MDKLLIYYLLVRYLLEAGADVHAQTQTGDTALTYACENGHTDVADLLIQYGANMVHFCSNLNTFTYYYIKYYICKYCKYTHLPDSLPSL